VEAFLRFDSGGWCVIMVYYSFQKETTMELKLPSEEANHISDSEDERNKRLIARGSLTSSIWSMFSKTSWSLSSEHIWLINTATPHERQVYVRRRAKISLAILIFWFAGIFLVVTHLGNRPKFVSVVEYVDAGTLQELRLHQASFSTATTVITSAGVFQVRGGVSASTGSLVRVRSTSTPSGNVLRSLCIDTGLLPDCHPLK
jgi:hypothetical protein